jgi:hypothetical protein
MMIKVITPHSQDFGESVSSLIKVSSKGLVGSDLSSFVKRAGSEAAHMLKGIEFNPGEQPIHMIAIGSTEAYGPNRNGDGFKEATCRKYHDTFVKHARWYRNHKNKDPKASYGLVKASMYNDKMKRVELIVALNGTKEAASRNGGLLADKEMQKIASGDDNWGVSMACKVAYDVCSGCGNKARNRDEYCNEDKCNYGGCRLNLTKVAEDGHVLHVDNPNPTWFDISDVYRPADRIAWVVGHYKAASGLYVAGGAELAEMAGVDAPDGVWSSDLSAEAANLAGLAKELAAYEKASSFNPEFITAVHGAVKPLGFFKKANISGNYPWAACAKNAIIVPVEDWLAAKGQEKVALEVKKHLPNVFSKLIGDVSTIEKIASDRGSNPYKTTSTERQHGDAIKQASSNSVSWTHLEPSVRRAVISNVQAPKLNYGLEKFAEGSEKYAELAKAYAVNQLQWIKAASSTPAHEFLYGKVVVAYNRLS